MHITRILLIALAVLAGWMEAISFAAEKPRWGIAGGSSLHFNCPSYCQGDTRDVYTWTGQIFSRSLTNEAHATFGNTRVVIEMKGETALFPRIHGMAESLGDSVHASRSTGTVIEGYRYIGANVANLEFQARLAGTSNDSYEAGGLTAQVYFFKKEGFSYITDIPTLIYETPAQPITNVSLRISSTNSGAILSSNITIPIQPGEIIYLFSQLDIWVHRANGYTDAPEGLDISTPQSHLVVSESLAPDRLALARKADNWEFSIPPIRRPFRLQQSDNITTGWLPIGSVVLSNEFGFSFLFAPTNAQTFFRALLD
ncbi:MAG TPA: hypothetical protein VM680_13325 [Verrucomicrobiae bacterium]|nr:hypothetical protein [Verrucomicrobiae bacterium]